MAEDAFHVDGRSTKKAALNQRTHFKDDWAELRIMADGQLQTVFVGERDQCLSL